MHKYIEKEIKYILNAQYLLIQILPLSLYHYISCLGTHSFYFVFLPLLYWLDSALIPFGRGIVLLLASGVYSSGFVKDLLCLPRPKHSQLKQYKVKTYHSEEYGFPSTHATNAISISLYTFLHWRAHLTWIYICGLILYTLLICLSRIALGLHGFIDLIGGLLIGTILTISYHYCEYQIQDWIIQTPLRLLVIECITILIIMLYIHPDPKQYCPCFIDSISFVSVVVGVVLGEHIFYSYSTTLNTSTISHINVVLNFLKLGMGILGLLLWKISIHKVSYLFIIDKESAKTQIPRFDARMNFRILLYVGIGFISSFVIPLIPVWISVTF